MDLGAGGKQKEKEMKDEGGMVKGEGLQSAVGSQQPAADAGRERPPQDLAAAEDEVLRLARREAEAAEVVRWGFKDDDGYLAVGAVTVVADTWASVALHFADDPSGHGVSMTGGAGFRDRVAAEVARRRKALADATDADGNIEYEASVEYTGFGWDVFLRDERDRAEREMELRARERAGLPA